MIGRDLTRAKRTLIAFAIALCVLFVSGVLRHAVATPIVIYSSIVHVPSDPSTGSGFPAALGTIAVVDGQTKTWIKSGTGNTAWTRTDQGAATGGFSGAWTTGTYNKGAVVSAGPYLLAVAANPSTANNPVFDFNSVASNAIWQLNGTGASQDSVNGILTLANSTSQNSSVIYKTTVSGWDRRTLIVDLEVTGTADGLSFGILDGSLASTTAPNSGMSGVTGFWGVDFEIYDPGTPGYFSVHDGTKDSVPFADTNARMTNASTSFDRYYLDLQDNGVGAGSITMTLRRSAYAFNPNGNNNNVGWSIDTVQIGTWTVTPRPTFTNWKFALGAHTGGSSGTFKVKNAWALDKSGAWTVIGLIPTRL